MGRVGHALRTSQTCTTTTVSSSQTPQRPGCWRLPGSTGQPSRLRVSVHNDDNNDDNITSQIMGKRQFILASIKPIGANGL